MRYYQRIVFCLTFILVSAAYLNAQPIAFNIGGTSSDWGTALAADGSGGVFVSGYFRETADFDPGAGTTNLTSNGSADVFLARYNASGALVFAIGIGGTGYDQGTSLVSDGAGGVFITGYFRETADFDPGVGTTNLSSNGSRDIFVARYTGAGALIFAFNIGGTDSDRGLALTSDGSGGVFVTGNFSLSADFDPGAGTNTLTSNGGEDIFLARYSSAGAMSFAFNVGSTSTFGDEGLSLAPDGTGGVFVTGKISGAADFDPGAGTTTLGVNGTIDMFLARYSGSGSIIFGFSTGSADGDIGTALVADGSGGVFIAGLFQHTVDFDPDVGTLNLTSNGLSDIFLARYNSTGAVSFAVSFGNSGIAPESVLASDGAGGVFISGWFENTVDFDPDVGTMNLTSNGARDIFVARFSSAGALDFAFNIGGTSFDQGLALAPDGSGGTFVTGNFGGTVDFNPSTGTHNLTTNGTSDDLFLARYRADGSLPVELSRFEARVLAQSVSLIWETASETNNAGFAIEHQSSESPTTWTEVGWVAGAGTSRARKSYQYTIDALSPGRHRFRLRQVDFDGTFSFSERVEVNVAVPGMHLLEPAYPNPFQDQAVFALRVARTQWVRISLFDARGRRIEVLHDGVLTEDVPYRFVIDGSDLPGGMYVYRVQGENFSESGTVIR